MEFWNNKINVSKEAASKQIEIINSFSENKRLKIALDFANLSVGQTRVWIKKNNPNFSDLEVNLEFVRLMYFETGQITEDHWEFYADKMKEKIKKIWSDHFQNKIRH